MQVVRRPAKLSLAFAWAAAVSLPDRRSNSPPPNVYVASLVLLSQIFLHVSFSAAFVVSRPSLIFKGYLCFFLRIHCVISMVPMTCLSNRTVRVGWRRQQFSVFVMWSASRRCVQPDVGQLRVSSHYPNKIAPPRCVETLHLYCKNYNSYSIIDWHQIGKGVKESVRQATR